MQISQLHWQEPTAKQYLQQYNGSKSGAHFFLHDTQPSLHPHLPTNAKYLAPDDDVEQFVRALDYSKPKVVRGCHLLDFVGIVDVIDTAKNQKGKLAVRKAIDDLIQQASGEDVKSYIEYESGLPFDGRIGILVEDYYGEERGSVIEHPHMKGIYRVGKVTPTALHDLARLTGRQVSVVGQYNVDEEVCDVSGRAIDPFRIGAGDSIAFKSSQSIEQNEAAKVIELYKRVADSGLIPEGYSFQMEYGIDKVTKQPVFYQARLFRPFIDRANYERDDVDWDFNSTRIFNAFGITQKEGIETHLAYLDEEGIKHSSDKGTVAFAYSASGKNQRGSTSLDIQPKNIGVYLPYQYQLLEHGHYRWLQKAPVSLAATIKGIEGKLDNSINFAAEDGVKVRVWSNGIVGGIGLVDDK